MLPYSVNPKTHSIVHLIVGIGYFFENFIDWKRKGISVRKTTSTNWGSLSINYHLSQIWHLRLQFRIRNEFDQCLHRESSFRRRFDCWNVESGFRIEIMTWTSEILDGVPYYNLQCIQRRYSVMNEATKQFLIKSSYLCYLYGTMSPDTWRSFPVRW